MVFNFTLLSFKFVTKKVLCMLKIYFMLSSIVSFGFFYNLLLLFCNCLSYMSVGLFFYFLSILPMLFLYGFDSIINFKMKLF